MNIAENFPQAVTEARLLVVGWDHEAVFRQRAQFLAVTVSDSAAGTEKLPDQDFAIVFASARCTRGARDLGEVGHTEASMLRS
jgi:hypothetical protein